MVNDLTGVTDADVIIVGAGPAGSSTAYHLAKLGIDVLVLEKAEFPRPDSRGRPRLDRDGHGHLHVEPKPRDDRRRRRTHDFP